MRTKICYKCGIEKPLNEFNKNKCRKDGLDNNCKECTKIHAKEFYENKKRASKEG